jgi:hypothetical protein
MTEKFNFDAIPGHREIEKPEAPSTTKPLDFSGIFRWRQISPAPSAAEETANESEATMEE